MTFSSLYREISWRLQAQLAFCQGAGLETITEELPRSRSPIPYPVYHYQTSLRLLTHRTKVAAR